MQPQLSILKDHWSRAEFSKPIEVCNSDGQGSPVVILQESNPSAKGSPIWEVTKALDTLATEAIATIRDTVETAKKSPKSERPQHLAQAIEQLETAEENLRAHDSVVSDYNKSLALGTWDPRLCPTHQSKIQEVKAQIADLRRQKGLFTASQADKMIDALEDGIRDGLDVDRNFILQQDPKFMWLLEDREVDSQQRLLQKYRATMNSGYLATIARRYLRSSQSPLPESITRVFTTLGFSAEQVDDFFREAKKILTDDLSKLYQRDDDFVKSPPMLILRQVENLLIERLVAVMTTPGGSKPLNELQRERIGKVVKLFYELEERLRLKLSSAVDKAKADFLKKYAADLPPAHRDLYQQRVRDAKIDLLPTLLATAMDVFQPAKKNLGAMTEDKFAKMEERLRLEFRQVFREATKTETTTEDKETTRESTKTETTTEDKETTRKATETETTIEEKLYNDVTAALERLRRTIRTDLMSQWDKRNKDNICFFFNQAAWGTDEVLGDGICLVLNFRWLLHVLTHPTVVPKNADELVDPSRKQQMSRRAITPSMRFQQAKYSVGADTGTHTFADIPADVLKQNHATQAHVSTKLTISVDELFAHLDELQRSGQYKPEDSNGVLMLGAVRKGEFGHAMGIQIDPKGNYAFWDVNHCFARYKSKDELRKEFTEYLACRYPGDAGFNIFFASQITAA